MPTEKEDLIKILQSLDSGDDVNWTDDGAPRVDAVQALANDKTITRAQINEVLPGFARVTEDAPEDGKEGDTPQTSEVKAADTVVPGIDTDAFDVALEPEVNGPGEQLTEDEVKQILARRISDAEQYLEKTRANIRDANDEMHRATKRVDRAKADYARKFPPISAAENIKQHLAMQQQLLRERVEGAGGNGRGQLDQAMERRNSRGWSRPARPLNNVA